MSTYRALLTQEGSAAPSATVKKNTTGMSVVPVRDSMGNFALEFSGAIDPASVEINCRSVHQQDPDDGLYTVTAFCGNASTNRIVIVTCVQTKDTQGDDFYVLASPRCVDGVLKNWSIEVRL